MSAELDLQVAEALGLMPGMDGYMNNVWYRGRDVVAMQDSFSPSTSWAQGGPILAENWEAIKHQMEEDCGAEWPLDFDGDELLEALLKALVASKEE